MGTTKTVYCQSREEKRRKCNSCKCIRAITDFTGAEKTCTKCRKRKSHEKLARHKSDAWESDSNISLSKVDAILHTTPRTVNVVAKEVC